MRQTFRGWAGKSGAWWRKKDSESCELMVYPTRGHQVEWDAEDWPPVRVKVTIQETRMHMLRDFLLNIGRTASTLVGLSSRIAIDPKTVHACERLRRRWARRLDARKLTLEGEALTQHDDRLYRCVRCRQVAKWRDWKSLIKANAYQCDLCYMCDGFPSALVPDGDAK